MVKSEKQTDKQTNTECLLIKWVLSSLCMEAGKGLVETSDSGWSWNKIWHVLRRTTNNSGNWTEAVQATVTVPFPNVKKEDFKRW